jgi:hypothetical protein
MRCKFQVKQYLIDHESAEALTTGQNPTTIRSRPRLLNNMTRPVISANLFGMSVRNESYYKNV